MDIITALIASAIRIGVINKIYTFILNFALTIKCET